MIEHTDVYVMRNMRPVEVVGFYLLKIPTNTRDRHPSHVLEPVLGDVHILPVASSLRILVLPVFLLEDR